MIDFQSVDPCSLPFKLLENRSQLPAVACVYFAIDKDSVIQYIGKANNLKTRWFAHHKGVDLGAMGDVKIAYLEAELAQLPELEEDLIKRFTPKLNAKKDYARRKVKQKFCPQIERIAQVNAPNIGERIKNARERDPRPVGELAKAADMTRANWYRIENEEYTVLPEATLRKIEQALNVDFGVVFPEVCGDDQS